MARYSPFTRNRTPMSLPRTRPIFDEESETTDMFLRASPRESEGSYAGDDVQGVVRGLARVQLSQQQKEPQSDDLDDLEPFAEPTKAQRPQPTHAAAEDQFSFPAAAAASGSAAPIVAKSPFRSPARRRPRRLRSILKKPADDNGSAAKKMVSFSGVPDSSPVAGPVRAPPPSSPFSSLCWPPRVFSRDADLPSTHTGASACANAQVASTGPSRGCSPVLAPFGARRAPSAAHLQFEH